MAAFRSVLQQQQRSGLLSVPPSMMSSLMCSSPSTSSILGRRSLSAHAVQTRVCNINNTGTGGGSITISRTLRSFHAPRVLSNSSLCNHQSAIGTTYTNNRNQRHTVTTTTTMTRRFYTPMTTQEEEMEKERVKNLTAFSKEQELRKLNREIAKLEMLRGINTGELYTWTGKYKALSRDYGFPLVAWYASVWGLTGVLVYMGIEVGGIDAMALVARVDSYTGWDMVNHIDPSLGKIGLTLVLNEMIEPLRLPVVILTVKPVMDRLFPPKY